MFLISDKHIYIYISDIRYTYLYLITVISVIYNVELHGPVKGKEILKYQWLYTPGTKPEKAFLQICEKTFQQKGAYIHCMTSSW